MGGTVVGTSGQFNQVASYLATDHVRALLDTMDRGILIANREGEVLILN